MVLRHLFSGAEGVVLITSHDPMTSLDLDVIQEEDVVQEDDIIQEDDVIRVELKGVTSSWNVNLFKVQIGTLSAFLKDQVHSSIKDLVNLTLIFQDNINPSSRTQYEHKQLSRMTRLLTLICQG